MAKKLTDVDITTVIDDAIKLFIQTKENDKDCVRKIDIVQFKNYIIETLNIPVATKTNNGLMSRDNVSTLESLDTQTANLITKIGTLDNLTTGQKTNLVNAINEIKSEFDSLKQSIGNTTSLSTTSKEIVGAVNELNSALLNKQSYPDYSKISTIISGGVGTKTYTCTENGFVQFVGASGNNSVKPEIDLSINGVYVYKFRTGYQTIYVKATSGLFPVKQGDVIKCVIQSSFVADESVRFYQLRY